MYFHARALERLSHTYSCINDVDVDADNQALNYKLGAFSDLQHGAKATTAADGIPTRK